MLWDKETDRVLGGAIVGPNAGDLIAEVGLAIEMGADAADIGLTVHPAPDVVRNHRIRGRGLRRATNRPVHAKEALACCGSTPPLKGDLASGRQFPPRSITLRGGVFYHYGKTFGPTFPRKRRMSAFTDSGLSGRWNSEKPGVCFRPQAAIHDLLA